MNSTDAAPLNHPFLADSLYYGPLGVAIYLQQLGSMQPGWRGLAMSALEAGREYATSGAAVREFGSNAGFYYGLAGIAYGLRVASDGMPNASRFEAAASTLETHVLSTVAPFSSNTSATLWNNTDIAHGAAGTGLYLLWLSRRASLSPEARQAALQAATRAGHWLLSRAEPVGSDGGLRWARGPDTDGVHAHAYFPTFCCGGAGVAHMLSELSQAPGVVGTADAAAFLDAARRGAAHVVSLGSALPTADGLLVPHEEEGDALRLFYLGWCGGPPGWARLLVSLHRATRDARWLEALAAATRSTIALVVPASLAMLYPWGQPRPWDNLGQCCGASAAGQFLLSVGESDGADLPLDAALKRDATAAGLRIAEAVAARGVAAAPDGRGRATPSPEEHAAPLDTRWQAGWMQGAAGVGSLLLHAHAVASGGEVGRRVPWPDEPWGRASAAPTSILAVTSADGQEGVALISALLEETAAHVHVHVQAIVANLTSADARRLAEQGCTLRLEGAPDAFAGASWALILPPLTADRLQRATAAIEQAAAAGVPAAFLLSVIGADSPSAPPSLADYGKLEQALLRPAAFARAVILRTFFYSSNLLLWARDVRRTRALRLPLPGEACLAPLYAGDVSAVVASLVSPNSQAGGRADGSGSGCGGVLTLTGPTWHGGASIAAIASAAVGAPLSFDSVQNTTVAAILEAGGGGLDPSEARLLLGLLALQRRPEPCEGRAASRDFLECTGRNASSLQRFFTEHAQAFRPPV